MLYVIYTLHALVCLFLILVVLLQQGKGADLSVFGGGATMTAFGARGSATLLHKLTVGSFILFIVTTLAIGVLQGKDAERSVVGDEPAPAATPGTPAGTGDTPPATPAAAPAAALPSEDEAAGEAAPTTSAEPTTPPPAEAPATPPPSEAPAGGGTGGER